jgi:HK97 family phage prohead protease
MLNDSLLNEIATESREMRILSTAGLSIETRALTGTDGNEVQQEYFSGCAVKYGVRSQDLGGFVEIIDEHAFDECDMSDVVCLINHDNNIILGRTLAGTLTLDNRAGDGLYFLTPVDNDDPDHVRYKRKIQKGEIRGCSFQFVTFDRSDATVWDWEQNPYLRTVKQIKKLYDVGPVTFPAYLQTNTDVAKRDLSSAKEKQKQAEPPTPPASPTNLYEYRARALAHATH